MGGFAVDLLMALLMGTLATQYQQMGWAWSSRETGDIWWPMMLEFSKTENLQMFCFKTQVEAQNEQVGRWNSLELVAI